MPRPSQRDKILEAGLETLRRLGYNGCGVQDITDAAGVPKGSFYNHFASKEELGAAAIEQYWQRGTGLARTILSDETLQPVERLRRYFGALAEKLTGNDYSCGCLIGNLSAELSDQSRLICDRLAEIYAGWTRAIESCLRDGQRDGSVRNDLSPEILAAFLVNAWEGAVLRTKVEKDGSALAAFNKIVFEALLT
jgi:TetR/AcrR family transcriptional repressor of nem operon